MESFLGEIQIFGFNYAPYQWSFANGAVLPIAQNTALFSLLGTTYGGNGLSNFALPNLNGRQPTAQGQAPGLSQRDLGENFGTETVTLLQTEMPMHTHTLTAYTKRGQTTTVAPSSSSTLTAATKAGVYSTGGANTALNGGALTPAGGSQAHPNQQPYLALNYCIALQGIFPARN